MSRFGRLHQSLLLQHKFERHLLKNRALLKNNYYNHIQWLDDSDNDKTYELKNMLFILVISIIFLIISFSVLIAELIYFSDYWKRGQLKMLLIIFRNKLRFQLPY